MQVKQGTKRKEHAEDEQSPKRAKTTKTPPNSPVGETDWWEFTEERVAAIAIKHDLANWKCLCSSEVHTASTCPIHSWGDLICWECGAIEEHEEHCALDAAFESAGYEFAVAEIEDLISNGYLPEPKWMKKIKKEEAKFICWQYNPEAVKQLAIKLDLANWKCSCAAGGSQDCQICITGMKICWECGQACGSCDAKCAYTNARLDKANNDTVFERKCVLWFIKEGVIPRPAWAKGKQFAWKCTKL